MTGTLNIIQVGNNMEILRWLGWVWRQWEFWQKTFVVAFFCMGAAVGADSPYDKYFAGVAMVIFFSWTFKWWFVDVVKASYAKYKSQRDGLFKTIKGE